ncbi:MAG: hypothetical protein LCH38_02780 [Proteobacteria bacterium]|nr:hypothetical protein [Pseudomonadota bacterium]
MSAERRTEARNPCFLQGSIIIDAQKPPVPCEVHDISNRGMRLVVANTAMIPNQFIVSVPRRHMRELVSVRRRGRMDLGVLIVQAGGAKR